MSKNLWKGGWDPIAVAAGALAIVAVGFGGASKDHALRLAVVELASLPLFVLALSRFVRAGVWQDHKFALALLAGVVAVPLIQLIPLPPAVWGSLPGRDQMILALQLSGIEPGWAPLSMTPSRTWASALALIPAVACFFAMFSLSQAQRERMAWFLITSAFASVVLGAAQLADGGNRLNLWDSPVHGQVRGFFANRNHFASYLLVVLPFALTAGAAVLRRTDREKSALWIGGLFAGVVVVALAAIRSRAGMVLLVPTLVATLAAVWIAAGRGRVKRALLVLTGAVAAALTVVSVLALPPVLARFDRDGAQEVRFERWPLVAETAQAYLPLGTGMGSFNTIYRSVETREELDHNYFNQAHNDYLEIWLEAGWIGIGLIVAFMVWFARRTWPAWRSGASRVGDMQRSASIGIGVLLLHSAVDYPLRTVTLAVIFAICCGLLEFSPSRVGSERRVIRGER